MKILITGGAGFIGSHLVDALLAEGHSVFVIDNLVTGRLENLPESDKNFWFFRKGISGSYGCFHVFGRAQPDVVVHAAASYRNPDDWITDVETNVNGTVNVVRESLKFYVRRFIYLQTSLCYGPPRTTPIALDHPLNPTNSYAISKVAAERYIMLSGLDYVSFRLANCYGPRNLSGPIPTFYKKLEAGEKCTVVDTRRDFVYIDDLIHLILLAIKGVGKGVYHVSTGRDYSIKDIYKQVEYSYHEVAPSDVVQRAVVHPVFQERGKDDVETILLDPLATEREFGFLPSIPLKDGIRAAVQWYDKHGVGKTYTHLRGV